MSGDKFNQQPTELDLNGISPAEYNPRFMPEEEMEALKASMREHGLVLNLVVQREADDGTPHVLIGGHQRLKALREICEEDDIDTPKRVWAMVVDINDSAAKRLNVALNKISGEFDEDLLGRMWLDMVAPLTDVEIAATGFTREQIVALVGSVNTEVEDVVTKLEAEADEIARDWSPTPTLTVDFDTKEERDEAKRLLKDVSGKERMGAALLRILQE